jgi:hypothetical protein
MENNKKGDNKPTANPAQAVKMPPMPIKTARDDASQIIKNVRTGGKK